MAVMDRRLKSFLKENSLDHTLKRMNFGQILFLYFFGRNVEYNVYHCVLEKLCESSPKKSLEMIDQMENNYHSQPTLRQRKKVPIDEFPLEQIPAYGANNAVSAPPNPAQLYPDPTLDPK